MIKEFSKKCLKKWLFLFCSDMLYNHLKTEFITKKKKKKQLPLSPEKRKERKIKRHYKRMANCNQNCRKKDKKVAFLF